MWNKDEPEFSGDRQKDFRRSSQECSPYKQEVPQTLPPALKGTSQNACEYLQQPVEDTVQVAPAGEIKSNAEPHDENAEKNYEILAFGSQLTSPEGVGKDMGTIALERFPAERLHQGSAGLNMSTRRNEGFGQLADAEIMLRAGAGDDGCFEYLAAKYRRPIISFMYRMVHNQAIAEELAQEVFLRIYRARASYRADARFTTWLYRIASNTAINHARDTKAERGSSSVYLDEVDEETGTTPDVADSRPLAEQGMLRDERMRHIRDQVMALPERQRAAVIMHKYQEMDYKQIGTVLKLSESATKSLLFRAYQTLRERLKDFA
ncbi:MAG TPA: sigma-70 family RNA polymerase sigma factor [Acidobacteriaceae bacterium]|nr:sigma-70 family RNA polymerase sigma factor [Acidobacteriaceae bacterium]